VSVCVCCDWKSPKEQSRSRTMSRENSVKRKSGSQTSLKKDSEKQAEKKRLIQEETVEQGSVSGFLLFCFQSFNLVRLFLSVSPRRL